MANLIYDTSVKNLLVNEENEILEMEKHYIPTKINEFRSNKHFVVEPVLKTYQFIRPNSQVFQDLRVNDHPVYERTCIADLHTKAGWKKLRRQVRKEEKPLKAVKGHYNEKTKQAQLYGFW
jgi:hypothetical protein